MLRDDGTLWIVIGDSYARNPGKGQHKPGDGTSGKHAPVYDSGSRASVQAIPAGTKEKDLIGIPWMLAFALRDAGWYLRQEIVWAKGISGPIYRGGTCMPESVKDRCTRSHETIFLLTRSPRYYFDHEVIKEPLADYSKDAVRLAGKPGGLRPAGDNFNKKRRYAGTQTPRTRADRAALLSPDGKRNRRSVWHVNPKPFKGAHFATFPPDLIEPMVLAGAPEGGLVLDPFAGAGTTGIVALQNGRSFVGIELNPEYADIARKRLKEAWANK